MRRRAVNSLKQHWQFVLLLMVAAPFFALRLSQTPATWYDEGLNLNAIRTLSETGIYGLTAADGIRRSDPAIQTGPPVIVPLAVFHSWYGPNLGLVRAAIAVCGLLVLVAMYALSYRLHKQRTAILSVCILLIMPGDATSTLIGLSRQVLGEVPALLLLCCGLLFISQPRPNWFHYGMAGLAFGGAIAIKSQVLVVLTCSIAVWAVYQIIQRRYTWPFVLLMLAVMFGVYGLDWLWRLSMASTQAEANAQVLLDGIRIHLLPFRGASNLSEIGTVARLGLVILGMSSYCRIRWRSPGSTGDGTQSRRHIEVFLAVFTIFWFSWWALVSIGWNRYAFVGFAFFILLFAFVIDWAFEQVKAKLWNSRLNFLLLLVILPLVVSLVTRNWLFEDQRGEAFSSFIRFIEDNIPLEARVVTWEWSAAYLTDHSYYLPTTRDANAVTQAAFLEANQDSYAEYSFDPLLRFCPQYVLLGSFQVDRIVLQPAIEVADPEPLYYRFPYAVYRIPPENLQKLAYETCQP